MPLPHKTNGYQRRAQATLAAYATTICRSRPPRAPRRSASRARPGSSAGTDITVDTGANQERRTIASIVTPNPASPAPNVNLTAPLTLAHASDAPVFFGDVGLRGNTAATARSRAPSS